MSDAREVLPYCDLVMKGGITSGVIYPRLIARLSKVYRFKNIGGASAGAIAAAGAAAAEYGCSHGNAGAFDSLNGLPGVLSARAERGTRSVLFHLFQPAPAMERHFAVLLAGLNASSKPRIVLSMASGLLCKFRGAALLGAVPGTIALLAIVAGVTQALWPDAVLRSLGVALMWALALLAAAGAWRLTRKSAVGLVIGAVLGVLFAAAVLGADSPAVGQVHALLAGAASGLAIAAILATAVLAAALRMVFSLGDALPPNNFGICTGMPGRTGADKPAALTPWLYEYFNSLAGRPPKAPPLTFGDLWGCNDKPNPVDRETAAGKPSSRAINLEMMTTALSKGLPYRLPFKVDFLFDPEEWKDLFPEQVHALIVAGSSESDALHPDTGKPLRRLPEAADFPVVVAVRMSLSFPVLLSAIPLYSVDRSLRNNQGAKNPTATRVWFSDGGISSNLPLHFFDSKLPSHPTFAIDLKQFHPEHQPAPDEQPGFETGRVYLPQHNSAGLAAHWTGQARSGGLGAVVAFLLSIVDTMQNWRDQIQFPYPGYRDRIVRISQKPDEGGLNLDMPEEHITALGAAGENAAGVIIERFAPPPGTPPAADGWLNHRSVRLRTFLALLEDLVLEVDAADSPEWRSLLATLPSQAREKLAADLLDHVGTAAQTIRTAKAAARAGSSVSLADGAPNPRPELRVSPRI